VSNSPLVRERSTVQSCAAAPPGLYYPTPLRFVGETRHDNRRKRPCAIGAFPERGARQMQLLPLISTLFAVVIAAVIILWKAGASTGPRAVAANEPNDGSWRPNHERSTDQRAVSASWERNF
jgi:hypothetical protein